MEQKLGIYSQFSRMGRPYWWILTQF